MMMLAEVKMLFAIVLIFALPILYTAVELGKRGIPFVLLSILAASLMVRVIVAWLCGHTDELNKPRLFLEGVLYTFLFFLLFKI
jgi:hypothetical protein